MLSISKPSFSQAEISLDSTIKSEATTSSSKINTTNKIEGMTSLPDDSLVTVSSIKLSEGKFLAPRDQEVSVSQVMVN